MNSQTGAWLAAGLVLVVVLWRLFGANPDVIDDQHKAARLRREWRERENRRLQGEVGGVFGWIVRRLGGG